MFEADSGTLFQPFKCLNLITDPLVLSFFKLKLFLSAVVAVTLFC